MAVSQKHLAGKPLWVVLLPVLALSGFFWIAGEMRAQATVIYKEDINGDGTVNNSDIIALLKLGLQYPDSSTADFNGDGKWTITDAVKLVVNIAGNYLTPIETTPPPPANVTWTVSMANLRFVPSALTIAVGDTVKWVNSESITHTTTSGANCTKDGKWDSGNMTSGKTYTFVFTAVGTYPYYCIPHCAIGMVGTITVK